MLSGTTILLGVATLAAAFSNDAMQLASQSQRDISNAQPIGSSLVGGRRQLETPEVVLSVKYDRGSIDGIYLAQYRKGKSTTLPSVPEGTQLCQDLCHAGLGGDGCGSSCRDLVPVGLLQLTQGHEDTGETHNELETHTESVDETTPALVFSNQNIGTPRMGVCPILCMNNLGYPLCGCVTENATNVVPNWSAVCAAFCDMESYTLRGCSTCQNPAASPALLHASRILDTEAGWKAWCNLQCGQGQGGAACNCDMAPFSI